MTVHWIIDRALGRAEGGYEHLVNCLERTNTPYTLVRKPPFADYLIGLGDDHTPITIDVPNPVFVTGTTSMRLVCEKMNWNPGYIDAPGQEELKAAWGDELLNYDAVVGTFRDIVPPSGAFFIRPVEDTKSFAGQIMEEASQFESWRKSLIDIENSVTTLKPDDLIMMAPLKRIYAEYRLYVVDGEIVTGSRYKLGNKVFYTTDLDLGMIEYAKERIKEYCPRRALCLDIAEIEGDKVTYKVIETNAISSSGFYACDMAKFADAINGAFS